MSVNSIKKIIEARNYEEALEEVNSSIEKIKNELHNEEKYLRYKELINLRIYLNFQLSKEDDIIETIARKERYPFISFIDFGHNNYVKLLDKDIFHIKTGAYINAIHQNRIFEKTGKSFSKALENKVGKEEIEKQLLSEINNGDLPYYTITHKLSAPKSFHIPSITDQNTIDHQKLRNGLKHVLNNFITTKEKSFTFVAIGATAKLKNQDEQDEIIEIIAEELNDFFDNKPTNYEPEINFSFVNFKSLSDYERVLKSKTLLGKYYEDQKRDLSLLQKQIFEVAKTNYEPYKKQLLESSYSINSKTPILILGESGVGKTYIAKKIFHDLSKRADKNFEHVNCAGYPTKLLYNKLFGSVKGSYSGSIGDTKGVFEIAKGGTVFLDEIGSADEETQLSLMTFLDTGEFKPLGSEQSIKSECKLLFGTDQDLEMLVRKNLFRKQFYERISNDRRLVIPPLRERIVDMNIIIDQALVDLNKGSIKDIKIDITKDAREKIKSFLWPGNYRQFFAKMRNWHEDASSAKKIKIDLDIVNNNPPRTSFFTDSKIDLLEKLLQEYLENWNYLDKGKFAEEFIKPILAKIYLENLSHKYNKSDSNKILGFDGSRADSTLDRLYEKYKQKIKGKVS